MDHLLEGAEAEDEHDRDRGRRRGQHGDHDLLADRVGGDDRPVRRASEDLDEQRLLDAAPPGVSGISARDRLHAEHEHHVAHRAADPERVEKAPEGGGRGRPTPPPGARRPGADSGGGRAGS